MCHPAPPAVYCKHMQIGRIRRLASSRSFKAVLAAFVIVGVFWGGVFVGQGHLAFGRYGDRTGLPANLDLSSVGDVYQALRTNYDGALTEQQVIDGLKHGLANSTGDPYTSFFTAVESQEFNSELQGTITGIGAQLDANGEGYIIVVAPLAGSPAEAAGVRAKDVIVSVDGETTSGMTVYDAVAVIRGEKGSDVKLGIVRGGTQALELTITRDTIQVPTADSEILEGNIGYLHVSQFSDDTTRLIMEAAEKFEKANVQKVILDLRDNPGGEVTTAVDLTSLWLKQGDLIVQQRRGDAVVDNDYATNSNSLRGMKTVVLVNGGSASASEITALALRDQAGAYIIGEQSFGKGVVQQLIPFSDGSALKVTVAKWYSPKGTNINETGIKPDEAVTPSEQDYAEDNDVQLKAAQAWLATQ